MNTENRIRAIYIRVATEAQTEEGFSIQAQRERLEAYCKAMAWSEWELLIDGGFSGSSLDRPKMQQLIQSAKAGKVASVVVFKLDRLSRSQKDTLYLIEEVFIPNDVAFISLNENIDTSTPYGRAMIGILSAFAQLERENIFLRTRMGMLERVKQGYWRGAGKLPFGYVYDRNMGILVPHPTEADKVRRMYELYLEGFTERQICNQLDLRNPQCVRHILEHKCNIGIICYKGEEYKGLHEPIISTEIFMLTQIKLQERSQRCRVTPKKHNLLAGISYCGECGTRLRYISWNKQGVKLYCYSKDTSKKSTFTPDKCGLKPKGVAVVEEAVLDELFRISDNMRSYTDDESGELTEPLAEAKEQIRQCEARLKRLYNLYAKSEDDVLLNAISKYNDELKRLNAYCDDEEQIRARLKYRDSVCRQIADLRNTWEDMDDKQRQELVRSCINRVVVYEDCIRIDYMFFKTPHIVKLAT